jgi:hypothetical protein
MNHLVSFACLARTVLIALIGMVLISPLLHAQYYPVTLRPSSQEWMQVETEHFRLIYPKRYTPVAQHSLRILEREMASVEALMGGEIRRFPIILNPENDLSNGYVTPILFRSEVEIAPITGKVMNPGSGDWMNLVLPHELVHVMHFSKRPKLALTNVIGLFSPDFRRSIHSTAPFGVHEGIAVYHETYGAHRSGGRGNYPYFMNQFRVNAASEDPWSMGQLLSVTDATPPFDRHYIGGFAFTEWLIGRYGQPVIRRAIELNYRAPFLGFGVALRRATGEWPARLYRDFRDDVDADLHVAGGLGMAKNHRTMDVATEVPFEASCRRMSRPLWLDNEMLLFYGRSCNRPAGFYTVDLTSGSDAKLLRETALKQDYLYSRVDFEENFSGLLFARYHTDRIYDNVFRGDLHLLNLESGEPVRVTKKLRLSAPVQAPKVLRDATSMTGSAGMLFALQVHGDRHKLVRLAAIDSAVDSSDDSSLHYVVEKVYGQPAHSTVVEMTFRPAGHSGADALLIGRIGTRQALWLLDFTETDSVMTEAPLLYTENGSLFDPSWHPDGNSFLFVSDHTGVMQVYEHNLKTGKTLQRTETMFNAFEPSFSPDGSKIAFVAQMEEEQRVMTLELSRALQRQVSMGSDNAAFLGSQSDKNPPISGSAPHQSAISKDGDSELPALEPTSYKMGVSWLKPRIWLPFYEMESGRERWGVELESVDVMSRNAYSLELSMQADKLWYNFKYTSKHFFPGVRLEAYNEPLDIELRARADEVLYSFPFLQQSRGFSVTLPFLFRFEQQTRFTALAIEPEFNWGSLRLLDSENSGISRSSFASVQSIGITTALSWNIRRYARDIQPNAGWTFYAEALAGLNDGELIADVTVDGEPRKLTARLDRRRGLRLGVSSYLAPLARWNQSLRTGIIIYHQTERPVFNTQSEVSDHFAGRPLAGIQRAGIWNQRYTIPLIYPDDGGVLLPFYLSNVYAELFSQTLADLDTLEAGTSVRLQTVVGAGLRTRFRFGLIPMDLGISFGIDLGTGAASVLFGTRQ